MAADDASLAGVMSLVAHLAADDGRTRALECLDAAFDVVGSERRAGVDPDDDLARAAAMAAFRPAGRMRLGLSTTTTFAKAAATERVSSVEPPSATTTSQMAG